MHSVRNAFHKNIYFNIILLYKDKDKGLTKNQDVFVNHQYYYYN